MADAAARNLGYFQRPALAHAADRTALVELAAGGGFQPFDPSADAPASVACTSGSSGWPKGALLSHAGMLWSMAAWRQASSTLLPTTPSPCTSRRQRQRSICASSTSGRASFAIIEGSGT